MKKKILATKPVSRENTTSKPKVRNNLYDLKAKEVFKPQSIKNVKLKGNTSNQMSYLHDIRKNNKSSSKEGRLNMGVSDINKTHGELSAKRILDSNSGRNNIKIVKNENHINPPLSNTSNTSEDNLRAYENIINKMFKYLKDKVPQELYEEMKTVLTDEFKKSDHKVPQESTERKDSGSSAQEIINLVTKNSRNKMIDEKVLESIKFCDKSGKMQREGVATATNTNSNISNYSNAKNLKLSFDFSKPGSQSNSRTHTMNNKEGNVNMNMLKTSSTTAGNSKTKLLSKELTKDSGQNQLNLMNMHNKNSNTGHTPNNIGNLNLKGYLNFSNNFAQNSFHNQHHNIIQKSTENINLTQNKNVQQPGQTLGGNQGKSSLFNIIKVGNVTNVPGGNQKIKNLAYKSKTQSNSKSKSNSRDSRSKISSVSQSKNKLGLKKETVSLDTHINQVNPNPSQVNFNPNPQCGTYLKLNANLTKKTGISPETVQPRRQTAGSLNTVISTYNDNKFKANKNINLSSHSQFETGKKATNLTNFNLKNQLKGATGVTGRNLKNSEISINNQKINQSTHIPSPLHSSQQLIGGRFKNNGKKTTKSNKLNINQPHNSTTLQNTCYTGTLRDTYVSNNTNNSLNLNESKKIISNASKKIMDLTYNVSSKDRESARLSNREGSMARNTSIKYVDLNDIGIINSEATVITGTQKTNPDLIEIKGESKNNRNEINMELLKEIKLNLDDNLKNMFNFSYEYFHQEKSESGYSTKKSEDLSDNEINVQSDCQPDEMFKNGKKQNMDNFHNQFSFDENEERIKDKLFNKKNK